MKPQLNLLCIAVVILITFPFISLGFMAYWTPGYLEYLPLWYLQVLCMLANAAPPNYHAVLGLETTATKSEISAAYRSMALTCHPDKIPASTPPAETLALTEKFTRIAEANDMLSRETNVKVPELTQLQPRCAAALFLGFYWVLHLMMDFLEIEQSKERARDQLREAIAKNTQQTMPLNLAALGLEDRSVLDEYCSDANQNFYGIPLVQKNNLEDILEFRECLEYAGYELKPLPKGVTEQEPLFLPPPPPQPQAPEKPGWITWLEQPDQADNVLAIAFKGDKENLAEGIRRQSPHATITPGQRSAVYLAAMGGHADCIQILRSAGADVRLPDENGFSPLHMASAGGHTTAVEMLIKCSADVGHLGAGGLTPLHVASIEGRMPVVELLLKKKANIKAADDNGETPLFHAARTNRPDIVRCLVAKKVSVNILNKRNISSIWVASVMGNAAAVSTLHELGANAAISPTEIDPPILKGMTALQASEQCGKLDVANLLRTLDGLKDQVEEAKLTAREANVSKKAQDEQITSLENLKTVRAHLVDAYAASQRLPEEPKEAVLSHHDSSPEIEDSATESTEPTAKKDN